MCGWVPTWLFPNNRGVYHGIWLRMGIIPLIFEEGQLMKQLPPCVGLELGACLPPFFRRSLGDKHTLMLLPGA